MKKSLLKFPVLILIVTIVFISCSKKEDFSAEEQQQTEEIEIGLTFRKSSLKDQEIAFKVFDSEGTEITENITFFVDGAVLEGNTFQSNAEGSFEVYAEYTVEDQTVVTDTETFTVVTPKRKIVLEDYTGTWCGYCPSLDAAINSVAQQTNHISVVAIHNNDDLALAIEPTIRQEFGVFGFPSGRINRTTTWGSALNFPEDQVLDIAGENVNTAISIDSKVENGNLFVEVNVASEASLQDRKLVVYLVEDGIIRDQTNYFNNDSNSPYYQLGDPIIDFELNHVLRAAISDVFGDVIPNTAELTDYTANYNYNLPSDFVVENLSLVVMVVDMDNSAINSQHAHVGESIFYE
ncbi:Omp28-related outer membrane protein [Aureisphaera sp. CAU 1614]|uniref:Omp28-related outer membrane protein n=1 Tax=Halomarinibacterium sedimenti TaxID=2857106 RepID=A0A9X1FLF0_9FLAO|nr:Omp28-related outer membrane protein [Halomarinibacterium sedimenti]MBW2936651.1 Omp28-related outer membrane protein [Halomarinibacterium sedimenti]